MELKGNISDVRITKGSAKYKFPWWRRILIRLFGCSHMRRYWK